MDYIYSSTMVLPYLHPPPLHRHQVVQYTEIAGFLIALLVTAGDALQQIVLYKGAAHSLCRVAALALVGVALLPLLQIQHLGHMTQLAVLGVVTIAAAVVLFVSQISSNPQASSHVVSPTADFDDFAFALSTIIFAFQGQSIFPELQARMYSPQQFPRAMLAALAVVLVVFLAIAVVTYNLLGSSTLYVPEYIADERSSTLRTLLGNICLLIYCIMVFVVNANVLLHLILDGIVRAAEKRRRGERGAWELEDGQSNEDQCIEAGGDAPAVPSARKELLNAVHISTDFSIVPSVPPRTRRRWSWSKSKAAARMERMRASHHRKARLAWLATTSTALAAAFVSANLLPTPRHIIALVGALCGFSLTFVIPAASALRVFAKSLTRPQCILHWTVATFGALATFIGAYATAKELIHAWKDSDNKPFHC